MDFGTDEQILSEGCRICMAFLHHILHVSLRFCIYCAGILKPLQRSRFESALLLLVLGVLANDHHATLALNHLALLADGFYGRSYFHGAASLLHPIAQLFERQVIRPLVRS